MSNAIDVRTRVYCNRGPVISGSLEENTIVGAGLVNVTGNVVLDGVYRVKEGDVIELAYYKNGRMARLGRKLRATSVYANPITRTTEIALGCLLTYNKDNEPPPKVVNSEGDTDLPELTEIQKAVMIKPVSAKYVAEQICLELGIQHATFPLTNQFYRENFEVSGPYLNVLSDLLISENYVGYIDTQERLVFINLLDQGGSGPVLNESKIIDIEPINAGDPPADIVYANVTYKSVKLDASVTEDTGETDEEIRERVGRTIGSTTTRSYQDNGTNTRGFRWAEYERFVTEIVEGTIEITVDGVTTVKNTQTAVQVPGSFKKIEGSDQEIELTWADSSESATDYELFDDNTDYDPEEGGLPGKTYRPVFTYSRQNTVWGIAQTDTYFSYSSSDDVDTVVKLEKIYDQQQTIVEACGFPQEVISQSPYEISANGSGLVLVGERKTVTTNTEAWSETVTYQWSSRVLTSEGAAEIQQWIQSAENYYKNKSQSFARLYALRGSIIGYASDLVYDRTTVSYSQSPPRYEVTETELNQIKQEEQRDDPRSGATYTIVDNPEIVYVKNTGTGINLELTPPYMSDDRIIFNGYYYEVIPSDATEKATAFARTQNRLRRGYRNGQSIVYPIEYMPIAPFKPLYLSFGGVVGQFRADRTNIVFDSTGILVSTDAIFWGGVGR